MLQISQRNVADPDFLRVGESENDWKIYYTNEI